MEPKYTKVAGHLSAALALAFLLLVAARMSSAAITCGDVIFNLSPCLDYINNGGAIPTACCDGIRTLNAAANTTTDRRAACRCLKSLAKGLDPGRVSGLPGNCGVCIPYTISASVDCSKIR